MKSKIVVMFLLIITILGCARRQVAKYYILDYNPIVKSEAKYTKPFPYKVQVKEFNIDRTYDNPRILIRQSAHEVYYDRLSLWTARPQIAITNLLIKHINKLKLFRKCERVFLDEKPDYIISGTIHSIEKYQSAKYSRADLQISLSLIDVNKNQIVLNYEINKFVPLYTDNMNFFAKKISDVLNEEFDAFLINVTNYFRNLQKEKS
jgi:ABC-type uncharacterized transport system auxiliary subunit